MPDDTRVKLCTAQGTPLKRRGKVKAKLRLGGNANDSRENSAAVDFHVTDVTRTIFSVNRMVDAGYHVHFSPTDSYLENKTTGHMLPLHRHNGLFFLKFKSSPEPVVENVILAPVVDDQLFDAALEQFDPDAEVDDEMHDETLDEGLTLEDVEHHGLPAPGVERQHPVKPSQELIDEHNLTHAQYAVWCPACVAGRGQIRPHRRRDHTEDTLPVVQSDNLMWPKDYETSERPDNDFQDKSLTC